MFLLDRRIAGCTEATVAAYNAQLTPLLKWADAKQITLRSLREEHIRDFLLFRQLVSQAPLHASTVRLKTFFKWSSEQGTCNDLTAKLRKPKLEQKIISALSADEIRSMLAFCKSNGYIGRRDEALIRFLTDTGARIRPAGFEPKD